MNVLHGVGTLMLVITLATLALGVFDFVDAAVRRSDAFVAAGKLTKVAWLAITGASTVVLYLFGVISFFGIPAIVALLVYLVDVRPAVREVTGGRPPNTSW
ncbi:MAG: DUF2516 family protein [Actinomycetes bacterium]|jgi:hypothetical protein